MLKIFRKPKPITAPLFIAIAWVIRFVTLKLRRPRGAQIGKRVVSDPANVGLSHDIVKDLPRSSHHFNGSVMEPMNLIFIGEAVDIKRVFAAAGWYEAEEVSFLSLLKAQLALFLRRPYHHGPFTPLFVGQDRQAIAVQKPTALNQFKERHHARFWPTEQLDPAGRPIWIGAASFDIDIKYDIDARSERIFRSPPAHQIDPDLDSERDLIVKDLTSAGAKLNGYVQLQEAHEGTNGMGDDFHTDGRAAVIECT